MGKRDQTPGEQLWSAFEADALPHAPSLFRLAIWFERDGAEAEDLVQETLVQALQSFHRFKAGTNCRAWLVTILQHLRSNRRRAKGRLSVATAIEDRIAETVAFVPQTAQQLIDDDILEALRRIPTQYQEVIVLCDVEEMTCKEIAEALGVPMGTVMSRLHRGRELLRGQLLMRHGDSNERFAACKGMNE